MNNANPKTHSNRDTFEKEQALDALMQAKSLNYARDEQKYGHFATQQYPGSLGGSASAPTLREIPLTIGALFGLTEQLSESIARLGARLEPVLIPRPCGSDSECAAPSSSEIGGQLAQLALRIDLMINAIHSLDAQLQI